MSWLFLIDMTHHPSGSVKFIEICYPNHGVQVDIDIFGNTDIVTLFVVQISFSVMNHRGSLSMA